MKPWAADVLERHDAAVQELIWRQSHEATPEILKVVQATF
jgi:hypothetical protein